MPSRALQECPRMLSEPLQTCMSFPTRVQTSELSEEGKELERYRFMDSEDQKYSISWSL